MTLHLRHLTFRIFYSTTFSVLALLLGLLLLITPGDAIYQSYETNDLWDIVTVAGCHLCALLVCLFLYATRLYTTRSHLAAVPRSDLPVRKADAPPYVRRLIAEGLERSATIAYRAHPRAPSPSPPTAAPPEASSHQRDQRDQLLSSPENLTDRWSQITHAGWSSPNAPTAPSLHYASVVLELPHLVEAKAVSLAPPAPPPALLALLQRRPASSLHAYLTHLATLAMIPPAPAMPIPAAYFLPLYDRARFAATPLSAHEFDALMAAFGALLAVLAPPPEELLLSLPPPDETDLNTDYDLDFDPPPSSSPSPPPSRGSTPSTTSTVSHRPPPHLTPRPSPPSTRHPSPFSMPPAQRLAPPAQVTPDRPTSLLGAASDASLAGSEASSTPPRPRLKAKRSSSRSAKRGRDGALAPLTPWAADGDSTESGERAEGRSRAGTGDTVRRGRRG